MRRNGLSAEDAARAGGVPRATLFRWDPRRKEGRFQADSRPASDRVRTGWNGKTVRLPGFIVPIDFEGSSVTFFIPVPYFGACVHVPPPPPPNQLASVTTETPYESEGLFEAVNVTGVLGTDPTSTRPVSSPDFFGPSPQDQ